MFHKKKATTVLFEREKGIALCTSELCLYQEGLLLYDKQTYFIFIFIEMQKHLVNLT